MIPRDSKRITYFMSFQELDLLKGSKINNRIYMFGKKRRCKWRRFIFCSRFFQLLQRELVLGCVSRPIYRLWARGSPDHGFSRSGGKPAARFQSFGLFIPHSNVLCSLRVIVVGCQSRRFFRGWWRIKPMWWISARRLGRARLAPLWERPFWIIWNITDIISLCTPGRDCCKHDNITIRSNKSLLYLSFPWLFRELYTICLGVGNLSK